MSRRSLGLLTVGFVSFFGLARAQTPPHGSPNTVPAAAGLRPTGSAAAPTTAVTTPIPAPVPAISLLPGHETAHAFFAAPGNYGVSFGVPSYGSVRTYSEFSSPYGGGYRYGYAPASFLPGPYGVGLWKPGFAESPLYNPGASSYRTFPVPYQAGVKAATPNLGLYAPGFGPPTIQGWWDGHRR